MRLIADTKYNVCVCRRWVFRDTFVAIMRLRPEDLCKRLIVKFEDVLARRTITYYRLTQPRA